MTHLTHVRERRCRDGDRNEHRNWSCEGLSSGHIYKILFSFWINFQMGVSLKFLSKFVFRQFCLWLFPRVVNVRNLPKEIKGNPSEREDICTVLLLLQHISLGSGVDWELCCFFSRLQSCTGAWPRRMQASAIFIRVFCSLSKRPTTGSFCGK